MAFSWYIDALNGSSDHAGTAVGDAWAGFTEACVTLATANTASFTKPWSVFVAPAPTGYHGQVALSGNIGGANSSAGTYWYGDVNKTTAWTTAVSVINPSIVRITLADANEVPATGTLVVMGTAANNYFHDFQFDGVSPGTASANTTILGGSTANAQVFIRCNVIGGFRGFYAVSCKDCFSWSQSMLFDTCNSAAYGSVINCVGISNGGLFSPVHDSIVKNGYFFLGGSSYGFDCPTCEVSNNFILAGAVGIQNAASTTANKNIICALSAFRLTSTTPAGNIYIGCGRNAYTTAEVGANDISIYGGIETATSPPAAGHTFEMPPAMEIIRGISQAIRITKWNDYAFSAGASDTTLSDIEGRSRVGYTGTYSCPGPIQLYNQKFIKDPTVGNEIVIEKAAEEILYVPLKQTTSCTISVSCTYISGDTAPQVAFVFDPSGGIATKTATASNFAGHAFAIAIATNEVAFDQVGKLVLKGIATTATATAIFHSLVIT